MFSFWADDMLWVNRIYLGFRGDGLPDRKVRELRIRAGKTQKEIADYLNISRSTYTLYESAKRQMSNETLCALAEYYGVSTDYLLGRTDISSPPGLYTPQEIELIRQYRMLDERGRRSVEGALRFEQEWSYRQKKIRVSPTCGFDLWRRVIKLRERISIWIH